MLAWLVMPLALAACVSVPVPPASPVPIGPTPVSAGAEQVVELAVGMSAPVEGTGVTVTFVRVHDDSRCPVGVTCIWEGDAVVELRVAPASNAAETLRLHTNDRFAREGRAHGVTVLLERLAPLPTADGPVEADAYRAALRVRAQ